MTSLVWDLDLRRRFEHAHRRFDLAVRIESAARRLVLFGPSGAGKSQALKVVAGLTRPDAGHVRVAGRTLYDRAAGIDLPARERGLGYVFQDYALFPHLTVAQNIAFGLGRGWRNAGRAAAEREEAVQRSLASFELGPLARHTPDQLSGGQRQRVALARALATGPRALLLDEPFAALDADLAARLRDELAALQARLDLPLALITHDEADVRRFGGDVVVVEGGHVRGGGAAAARAGEARHAA